MSVAKAAVVVALDRVTKLGKRLSALERAVAGKGDAADMKEIRAALLDVETPEPPAPPVGIARGKSYVNKAGHLILVYTDGSEEDVGEVAKPTMVVRQMAPGGSSGLDRQQVIQLIEQTVSTSPLSGYRIADEDSDLAVKYYGYTDTAGKWYLMRVDDTAEIASYRYARGDSGYSAAWADRAAQVYGLLSEIGL